MPIKVLFIFGTRPEAIKLCPVIQHVKSLPNDLDVRVCVTAQQRDGNTSGRIAAFLAERLTQPDSTRRSPLVEDPVSHDK